MNYKYLTETVVAKIDDDGLSRSSCSIENPEYLAWLAEGNTPEPADVPPKYVPQEVSMRQARLALLAQGHYTTIQAAMSMQPEAAKIEWEYATIVTRDSALTQAMIAVLGLSDTDADDLFILAGGL
jgi:hypothetical protein